MTPLPLFSAAGACPVPPTSASHGAASAPGGAHGRSLQSFAKRAPRKGTVRAVSPLRRTVLEALWRLGPSSEREVSAALGMLHAAGREAVKHQLEQLEQAGAVAALRVSPGRVRFEALAEPEPEAPPPPPSGTRVRLTVVLPCGGAYAGRGAVCEATACRYHVPGDGPLFPPWCALDVADAGGGVSREVVAELLHLTRERVRQIEKAGLARLRKRAPELAALLRGASGAAGWTW